MSALLLPDHRCLAATTIIVLTLSAVFSPIEAACGATVDAKCGHGGACAGQKQEADNSCESSDCRGGTDVNRSEYARGEGSCKTPWQELDDKDECSKAGFGEAETGFGFGVRDGRSEGVLGIGLWWVDGNDYASGIRGTPICKRKITVKENGKCFGPTGQYFSGMPPNIPR